MNNESKFFTYSVDPMGFSSLKFTFSKETTASDFAIKVYESEYDQETEKETLTELTLEDGVLDVSSTCELIIVVTRIGNSTDCTVNMEVIE